MHTSAKLEENAASHFWVTFFLQKVCRGCRGVGKLLSPAVRACETLTINQNSDSTGGKQDRRREDEEEHEKEAR